MSNQKEATERLPKFRTPYNRHLFQKTGEINNLPSKTIPDQTLSIQEILIRYARGLPIENGKQPIYHGEDDDMPDLRTLDLAEIQELKENTKSTIDDYQSKVKKHEADKAAQKDKKIADLEKQLSEQAELHKTVSSEKLT